MRKPTPFLTANDAPPLMDINITPLIDVMLVLLIMMIITMPLMTHAVKVNLPHDGGIGPQREQVHVYIDFDGSLYWNDTALSSLTQLEQHLRSSRIQREQPNVVVQANQFAKYDVGAQVLAMAQRNGVQYLSVR